MWARLFVDDHEQYTSTHDRAEVEFSGSIATRLTILIRLKLSTPPEQQISKSANQPLKPKPKAGWAKGRACLLGPRAAPSLSLRNLHPGTGTGTALLLPLRLHISAAGTHPTAHHPTLSPSPLRLPTTTTAARPLFSSRLGLPGPGYPRGTTPSHSADLTLETPSFHDRQFPTLTTTNTIHETTTVSAETRPFGSRTTQRSPLPRLPLSHSTAFTGIYGRTQNTRTRTSREASNCTRSRRYLVDCSGVAHRRNAT